jgi:hypothetical protein
LTEEGASSCQTLTKKLKTGSTLPKQTGTSSSHGSSTDASSCQTLTEKSGTQVTLADFAILFRSFGFHVDKDF